MDWDLDLDLKSGIICIIVIAVSVAITTILVLGLINSKAGKFLRLQKFRNWIHIKLLKNSVYYFIIYFICGSVSVLIISDIDDYVLKGIITGIMFGFASAITYGSVTPKKKKAIEKTVDDPKRKDE